MVVKDSTAQVRFTVCEEENVVLLLCWDTNLQLAGFTVYEMSVSSDGCMATEDGSHQKEKAQPSLLATLQFLGCTFGPERAVCQFVNSQCAYRECFNGIPLVSYYSSSVEMPSAEKQGLLNRCLAT
jgi:hypothetical protein